jgi:hypothetical protein
MRFIHQSSLFLFLLTRVLHSASFEGVVLEETMIASRLGPPFRAPSIFLLLYLIPFKDFLWGKEHLFLDFSHVMIRIVKQFYPHKLRETDLK